MPQSVADTGVLGSLDDEVFLGATHGGELDLERTPQLQQRDLRRMVGIVLTEE